MEQKSMFFLWHCTAAHPSLMVQNTPSSLFLPAKISGPEQAPGSMSSYALNSRVCVKPCKQLPSIVQSTPLVSQEGNVCWLAGQQTDRYKMPPHSSFQASAIYRRESLVVPSFDFVESGKSFTLGKYFL